jgi:hypothetical protein
MDAEIMVRHHGIAVGELAGKEPYVAGLMRGLTTYIQ